MRKKIFKNRIFGLVTILLVTIILFCAPVYAYNDDGTTIPANDVTVPVYTPPTPAPTTPVVEPTTEETKNPVIKEVTDAITALPDEDKLTVNDKSKLEEIQKKYNTLKDTEKLEVTNYKKLETLAKKMVVLEKEAKKVFSYSFEITDETPTLILDIAYKDTIPEFTFVSPSQEEFIVTENDQNASYKQFGYIIVVAPNEQQTEVTTKDKTEEPSTENQTTNVGGKIEVHIAYADKGVWTLKSTEELQFSTKQPESEKPSTEEPSTELATQPEQKPTNPGLLTRLMNRLLNDKSFLNVVLYACGGIILIIVLLIIFLKSKKKHKNAAPQQQEQNQVPEFTPPKENSSKKQKRPKKEPKQKPEEFYEEPDTDITIYQEESDKNELEDLRASAAALFSNVEDQYQHSQPQKKKKVEEAPLEEPSIEYEYEWDDDDITVEEWEDGDIVVDTSQQEEQETLKKRRSFFPNNDRFD